MHFHGATSVATPVGPQKRQLFEASVRVRFARSHLQPVLLRRILLPISFFGIATHSSEVNRDIIVEATVIVDPGQFSYRIEPPMYDPVMLRIVNCNRAEFDIV